MRLRVCNGPLEVYWLLIARVLNMFVFNVVLVNLKVNSMWCLSAALTRSYG